ncbi:amidohydrolase family protein [candidate division KSB1 bacterium]|nr:amidohydrolase family protein [candidate division KSB1 bacterium]
MAPIIDIHTHLFSALDIPIEGYLRSRRSEKSTLSNPEYIANFFPGPQIFKYLADRMRERVITRQIKKDKLGPFYKFLLCVFEKIMEQHIREWEDSLTKTLARNASDLQKIWPKVDLYIPLVIDYEYWFSNTMDTRIDDQIRLMYEKVILPSRGKFHPFVPFDPVRELTFQDKLMNPDGQKEDISSLKLVKDAINEKGFIGVKLYNSLGYKPTGNKDTDEGKDRITQLYRWRIGVRNEKMLYRFDGNRMDDVLNKLYAWCEKEEVPITAHCMMHGIEAYPQASEHFGSAKFWRDVLDKYPKLHLNLAHFGWNPVPGHGYHAQDNWMREIVDMICKYDHLYADVSHHEVTSRGIRKELVDAYKKIQNDFESSLDKIRQHILYGSDWHVLRRMNNYESFMDRYIEIMAETGFYDEKSQDDFLGLNAMKFLGLNPGGQNRARLESFYKTHKITPPPWFQAAND